MPNTKTSKLAVNKSAEEPVAKPTVPASMDATPPGVDTEALAMEISEYVAEKITTMMDKRFGDLSDTLDNITTRLESNTKRITEAESRVSEAEDNMSAMESRLKGLETRVCALTERSIDIEGCSRRDNTLLNLETKQGIIKIDRAHRSLAPPKPNRSRAVIIKLHNPRDKMRILAAAKEKGQVIHEGQTIFIRQDLASGVKEMRRAFNGVCPRLIVIDIRFSMRFPATLSFSHGGKSHSFHSPKDALAYLDGLS
ncbi:hypothetical protein PBY51_012581 [Eleginops maclovinus]|uniref:L1 transposable element RRM domain-containing protein n=1 Tax=Eleginops maclovinus TaxID=56733 RepID=A0AAN7Y3T0_ELEMC|nr:hypothetical protein PBY51_012581 [Eleginops maclovinus]